MDAGEGAWANPYAIIVCHQYTSFFLPSFVTSLWSLTRLFQYAICHNSFRAHVLQSETGIISRPGSMVWSVIAYALMLLYMQSFVCWFIVTLVVYRMLSLAN